LGGKKKSLVDEVLERWEVFVKNFWLKKFFGGRFGFRSFWFC